MNKLLKNWSYLLLSDISQSVINFFVFMLLARKLTPVGYGEFNVILAIVAIFSVVATNLGANHVITREVTLHPDNTKGICYNVIPLRLIALAIAFLGVFVYIVCGKDVSFSSSFYIFILIFATSVWDFAESVAFGRLVTKYTTFFNLSFSCSWLLFVLFLPESYFSIEVVLVIYSLLFVCKSIGYLGRSCEKFVKTTLPVISLTKRSLFMMSLPYLWMRVFGIFGEQIPILILNNKCGTDQVGYFSVGFRLIIPITIAINTGLRVVFPFMTRAYTEDPKLFSEKLIKVFTFVMIWGTLVAGILVLFSEYWIPFFLGKSYLNSIDAFNYLAWFGVGMCFDLLLSTLLSSTYKQKILAAITTIDFFIVIAFLYWGAQYGAIGLALAKLLSMLFILGYHIIVVCKVFNMSIRNRNFIISLVVYLFAMSVTLFISLFILKLLLFILPFLVVGFIPNNPIRQCIVGVRSLIYKNKI